MIKLNCYGSKILYLKEAYRSYSGERNFTTVQITAANEIDGHKLSNLKTSLHILLGTEENSVILKFQQDNTAEYKLDAKYTANTGTIGFYLQFAEGEADNAVVGLTNTIYIDVYNNRINESTTTGNSSIDGSSGVNGKNGITYVPKVSEDGILSWTNDGGLPDPAPVNIKGKGDDGKSAYQVAVDNGFKGSEEEWLKSLNGKDYILTETDKQDITKAISEEITAEDIGAVPTTRRVGGYSLDNDITIPNLRDSLQVFPVRVMPQEPTYSIAGSRGQMYVYESGTNRKLYYCEGPKFTTDETGTTIKTYSWKEITSSVNEALKTYPIINFNDYEDYTQVGEIGQLGIEGNDSCFDLYIQLGEGYGWVPIINTDRVIERSYLVSSVDENSTDKQVPSAKVFYNNIHCARIVYDSNITESTVGKLGEVIAHFLHGDFESLYVCTRIYRNNSEGIPSGYEWQKLSTEYTLTNTDKQEIADLVIDMIPDGSEVEY